MNKLNRKDVGFPVKIIENLTIINQYEFFT